jgi:hypothetical protein
VVTDEDPRIAEARRIVRDFNRIGYAMRNSVATRTTALFAPVLCLPGILIAIPYTAHTVLHSETEPIGLLGTLFFGTIAYFAIKSVRRYNAAVRFLHAHGLQ